MIVVNRPKAHAYKQNACTTVKSTTLTAMQIVVDGRDYGNIECVCFFLSSCVGFLCRWLWENRNQSDFKAWSTACDACVHVWVTHKRRYMDCTEKRAEAVCLSVSQKRFSTHVNGFLVCIIIFPFSGWTKRLQRTSLREHFNKIYSLVSLPTILSLFLERSAGHFDFIVYAFPTWNDRLSVCIWIFAYFVKYLHLFSLTQLNAFYGKRFNASAVFRSA